jgi:hypothetical protein
VHFAENFGFQGTFYAIFFKFWQKAEVLHMLKGAKKFRRCFPMLSHYKLEIE